MPMKQRIGGTRTDIADHQRGAQNLLCSTRFLTNAHAGNALLPLQDLDHIAGEPYLAPLLDDMALQLARYLATPALHDGRGTEAQHIFCRPDHLFGADLM